MNRKRRNRQLTFDDSPANEAQKKIEADMRAMRAVPRGVQLIIESAVNTAVQEALKVERDRMARHQEKTQKSTRKANGAKLLNVPPMRKATA